MKDHDLVLRLAPSDWSGCGYRVQKSLASAHPYLSFLWVAARPGLERRAEHSPGWPGVAGRPPYRWASGNGFRDAGTERFGTDRLYARVRKSTSQTGWMNEESPCLYPGECQRMTTCCVPVARRRASGVQASAQPLSMPPPACWQRPRMPIQVSPAWRLCQ